MVAELGFLVGIGLVILLATGAVFVLARRARRSDKTAVLISGMFFPAFVLVVGSLLTFSVREVDGPPPGMTLLGLLLMSAVLTPITFLIGFLLARTTLGSVTPNVR